MESAKHAGSHKLIRSQVDIHGSVIFASTAEKNTGIESMTRSSPTPLLCLKWCGLCRSIGSFFPSILTIYTVYVYTYIQSIYNVNGLLGFRWAVNQFRTTPPDLSQKDFHPRSPVVTRQSWRSCLHNDRSWIPQKLSIRPCYGSSTTGPLHGTITTIRVSVTDTTPASASAHSFWDIPGVLPNPRYPSGRDWIETLVKFWSATASRFSGQYTLLCYCCSAVFEM